MNVSLAMLLLFMKLTAGLRALQHQVCHAVQACVRLLTLTVLLSIQPMRLHVFLHIAEINYVMQMKAALIVAMRVLHHVQKAVETMLSKLANLAMMAMMMILMHVHPVVSLHDAVMVTYSVVSRPATMEIILIVMAVQIPVKLHSVAMVSFRKMSSAMMVITLSLIPVRIIANCRRAAMVLLRATSNAMTAILSMAMNAAAHVLRRSVVMVSSIRMKLVLIVAVRVQHVLRLLSIHCLLLVHIQSDVFLRFPV